MLPLDELAFSRLVKLGTGVLFKQNWWACLHFRKWYFQQLDPLDQLWKLSVFPPFVNTSKLFSLVFAFSAKIYFAIPSFNQSPWFLLFGMIISLIQNLIFWRIMVILQFNVFAIPSNIFAMEDAKLLSPIFYFFHLLGCVLSLHCNCNILSLFWMFCNQNSYSSKLEFATVS